MKITILGIIFAFASLNIFASEFDEGKNLHDESCVNCHISQHNEDFYTKDNRIVKDIFGLKSQVSRCVGFFNTGWFPEEEASVVKYLNTEFYKFTDIK